MPRYTAAAAAPQLEELIDLALAGVQIEIVSDTGFVARLQPVPQPDERAEAEAP